MMLVIVKNVEEKKLMKLEDALGDTQETQLPDPLQAPIVLD